MWHFGTLPVASMKEGLGREEEKILEALFPDKRLWFREFLSGYEIADKPLRRNLRGLQKRGYIVKDKPMGWKRGMKIHYYLTPAGKHLAAKLIVGDKGRDIFIEVLDRIVSIAELYDDEGEKVLELALEIVNMLWDKEKSLRLREALCELVGELK